MEAVAIGTVLFFMGSTPPIGYGKIPDKKCRQLLERFMPDMSGPLPICIVKIGAR